MTIFRQLCPYHHLSTVRPPLRPVVSPSSSSQLHDREDKARRRLTREQSLLRPLIQTKPPQGFGQVKNNPSKSQLDSRSQGFERSGTHNLFQQQNFDSPSALKQESGQYSDKQQGILFDNPFAEYPPMHSIKTGILRFSNPFDLLPVGLTSRTDPPRTNIRNWFSEPSEILVGSEISGGF